MKNKHCEWCDNQFEAKLNYQIYCSPECRDEATKEKIAQRYLITRIKNRVGKKRLCKSCGSNLSVYNDTQLCQACISNPTDVKKILKDIKGMMNNEDK